MSKELILLTTAAASIGFLHTVFGPDHYLPFIVMSKARNWSAFKTTIVTLFCGIAHILSSVVLGFIGITLGIAIFRLEAIESFRGDIAGWLLLIFGFTYFMWGIHRALRNRSPKGAFYHKEEGTHSHLHKATDNKNLTPWILFTIFIFGPCEPLIPILMYPAAKGNMISVALVAVVFGVVTISTMLGIVLVSSFGLAKLPFGRLERYSHALAGLVIFLCGGAIKFLGL